MSEPSNEERPANHLQSAGWIMESIEKVVVKGNNYKLRQAFLLQMSIVELNKHIRERTNVETNTHIWRYLLAIQKAIDMTIEKFELQGYIKNPITPEVIAKQITITGKTRVGKKRPVSPEGGNRKKRVVIDLTSEELLSEIEKKRENQFLHQQAMRKKRLLEYSKITTSRETLELARLLANLEKNVGMSE